jgi:hypothetical protein
MMGAHPMKRSRPMKAPGVALILALGAPSALGCAGHGAPAGPEPEISDDARGDQDGDLGGGNDGFTGGSSGGAGPAQGASGPDVDASMPVFLDGSLGGFDGDLDALLGLLDELPIDLSGATGSCARLRTCCGSIASTFDQVSCKAIVQAADQAQCQLGLTDDEEAGLCP